MCASHLIVTIVLDMRNDSDAGLSEENREWNVEFWIFNICLFIANFPMTIANTGFIFFAFWDASRRIQLMRYMSNSLELDFKLKNKVTIRLPTLNFVDR